MFILIKKVFILTFKEFWITSTFKMKKFVSDPSKVNGALSLILAVLSIFLAFNKAEVIQKKIEEYVIPIIMCFLILIIWMLYRMIAKNEKILSLENDLRSETKAVWKEYGELNRFYKDINLLDLMKVYVEKHPHITSVQRYRYSIREKEKCTEIKLVGLNHFIDENVDLNTVSQAYFSYDKKEIKELLEAYSKSKISKKTKNEEDDDYSDLFSFFERYASRLYKTNSIDITDEDAFTYQLVKIAHQDIAQNLGLDFRMPFSKEQLEQLEKRKSGIEISSFLLKANLEINQEYNPFYYKGNSDSKKQRAYSNIQVTNDVGEQFVYVITHNVEELWSEKSIINQCKDDADDFVYLVKDENVNLTK